MHSRCCWPPERAPAGAPNRSLTSLHSPALVRQRSVISALSRQGMPARRRPDSTFSPMLMVGNGLGFWKTIPIRRRMRAGREPGA